MSYHGDNGWNDGYAEDDALTTKAQFVVNCDGAPIAAADAIFTKKKDSDARFLRVQVAPEVRVAGAPNLIEFFLDRDGIENLKLFLDQ